MDITGISVVLIAVAKALVWMVAVYYGYTVLSRMWTQYASQDEPDVQSIFTAHRGSIALWMIILFVVAIVSTMETAYRPKTVVSPRNEYNERIQAERGRPLPQVQQVPARESWEDADRRNRKENEEARNKFNELPDAQ